jgi:hypothetical protein
LTESKIHFTSLLVHWKLSEKEPWYLATNLPDQQMALKARDLKRQCASLKDGWLMLFLSLFLNVSTVDIKLSGG